MALTVLLVDDSRTMRQLIKVYLMGGQYEFLEAESAHQALEVLAERQVDLVIADVRMAEMDGIAFTVAVRSQEDASRRDVPLILMTGEHSGELRGRGMRAGADAFLFKPLSSDLVVEAVNRVLKHR